MKSVIPEAPVFMTIFTNCLATFVLVSNSLIITKIVFWTSSFHSLLFHSFHPSIRLHGQWNGLYLLQESVNKRQKPLIFKMLTKWNSCFWKKKISVQTKQNFFFLTVNFVFSSLNRMILFSNLKKYMCFVVVNFLLTELIKLKSLIFLF